MDTTKLLIGVLAGVLAIGAAIFVAPAFFGEKSPAATFDWQRYCYSSQEVCRYDIKSRRFDFSTSSPDRKAVLVRITVPSNAEFKHVKSALADVIRRTAARDRNLTAVMALAYYPTDQIPTSYYYTAGKAIWARGGDFSGYQPDQPYELDFFEPVKREKPKSSSSSSGGRGSSGRGSSSSGLPGYCPPPSYSGGGG